MVHPPARDLVYYWRLKSWVHEFKIETALHLVPLNLLTLQSRSLSAPSPPDNFTSTTGLVKKDRQRDCPDYTDVPSLLTAELSKAIFYVHRLIRIPSIHFGSVPPDSAEIPRFITVYYLPSNVLIPANATSALPVQHPPYFPEYTSALHSTPYGGIHGSAAPTSSMLKPNPPSSPSYRGHLAYSSPAISAIVAQRHPVTNHVQAAYPAHNAFLLCKTLLRLRDIAGDAGICVICMRG
ncbi:hypothetical protein M422DRAFT_263630 [Sphaerobolus stellatus SS14]|uniref:Uncharacterized protein n=1 Tax=Sphaerobolus stellatus (strain SS14) TaxID=990650 RepID=A0A0C9UYE6_SPHS4|nr:hypothetical protein M422DRAFT_263630 [Sphaerobolus stellatus SS14]